MKILKTKSNRGFAAALALVFFVLVVVATSAYFLVDSETIAPASNQSVEEPAVQVQPTIAESIEPTMDLKGIWTYDTGKGGTFEATVTDKNINIAMKTGDTSLNYWYGSFEPNAVAGAVIVSKVDENKAVISKGKTKEFTIGQDTLSFDFTMSGNTKKVELRRV